MLKTKILLNVNVFKKMNIFQIFYMLFFGLLLFYSQHCNASKQIAIGGLFTEHQLEELLVFCIAVDELQFQVQINETTIVPLVHLVSSFNSFEVNTKGKIYLLKLTFLIFVANKL